MTRTLRKTSVLPLLVLALAACGPTPPQAPLPYAKKLDDSTSGISTACGLSDQLLAFPGNHQVDLATLEATASAKARKLGFVYARNPAWIYQGETVREIVRDSLLTLRQCSLPQAAAILARVSGNS